MEIILFIVVAVIVGGGIGMLLARTLLRKAFEKKHIHIIEEAEKQAEVMKKDKILQAKEKFLQLKSEHEKLINDKNQQLQKVENRIRQKESNFNSKLEDLNKKNKEVNTIKQGLTNQVKLVNQKQVELEEILEVHHTRLEEISGYTAEEAKQKLMEGMTEEAKSEAMIQIKDIIEEAKLSANQEAKKLIIETMQRTAAEHAIENTVSVFNIENDEIKGRIIGREGRNIRALEALTGIEIIIDDSPEAIILSGFDPVRREIARLSLQKLVSDGRIHPARIEEVVTKIKKQVEHEIVETGKRTIIDLGIHNMHPELIRLIGKMKYRSSYGQNLLQHSIEVAKLASTMASELGMNPKKAKRAGLLHDIGKVPDNEPELPHAIIGMKLAEKYKEKSEVCNAIGAHHDEVEMSSLFAPIVQVCDAISGARPGARREVVEAYIQRLHKLEEMAMEYEGVMKTYAIQAGRELRVIVAAEQVNDVEAEKISYELSRKIQKEMTYPGQIKITVIRETRAINFAK